MNTHTHTHIEVPFNFYFNCQNQFKEDDEENK
jgi:hypothetical protein